MAGMTSCKKDYICHCAGQYIGQPYEAKQPIHDVIHSDAVDQCDAFEHSMNANGQGLHSMLPTLYGPTNITVLSINFFRVNAFF